MSHGPSDVPNSKIIGEVYFGIKQILFMPTGVVERILRRVLVLWGLIVFVFGLKKAAQKQEEGISSFWDSYIGNFGYYSSFDYRFHFEIDPISFLVSYLMQSLIAFVVGAIVAYYVCKSIEEFKSSK